MYVLRPFVMTEESELLKELREIKSEIKKLSEDVGKISFIIKEKWEREERERLGVMKRDASDYCDISDYLDDEEYHEYIKSYLHVYEKENDDEEED
jgi:hypothetical protein